MDIPPPPKANVVSDENNVEENSGSEIRASIFASKMWILTLLALVVAILTVILTMTTSAEQITIEFTHGHGLRVGDYMRYRGIEVGKVTGVRISKNLQLVEVTVDLDSHGKELAREGTRFWIERPQFSLTKMTGLDTLTGGRYIAVIPGKVNAPFKKKFIGTAQTRPQKTDAESYFDVSLAAANSYGLEVGAPVKFRGIRIGSIDAVGLGTDARRVTVRLSVETKYSELIRMGTKFWPSRGLDFKAGLLSGVKLDVESISALLEGGISVAVPNPPGARTATGHIFELHPKPEDEWLTWSVPLAIGPRFQFGALPQPERISISWQESVFMIMREYRQTGWYLKLQNGQLIAPISLLNKSSDAAKNVQIEFDGKKYNVSKTLRQFGKLGVIRIPLKATNNTWPLKRLRHTLKAEDTLIIAEPTGTIFALNRERVTMKDGRLKVNDNQLAKIGFHGANVISRADGALIGVLLVEKENVFIAPIPKELLL